MLRHFALAIFVIAFSVAGEAAAPYVVPTTTLAALTTNNTSAANSFTAQSNGNRGAGNVSKVDVHSLLYAGATTKVYAHMVLWFGGSSHMKIGYNSADPKQVKSQIDDMVSRGIDGVILDWYGPNNAEDESAQLIMAEAEKHPGFTFAIMVDKGAIGRASCSHCSPQQAFTSEMQYLEHVYFPSPAYMTLEGRPVVTDFNVDLSYPSVDWAAAAAGLSTRPVFLFQNNNGFREKLSDGSYAWVMPTTKDYGMHYLSSFYNVGETFPEEQTIGAAYKGFNDSRASWGSNRIMGQQCGQTWLQTFEEINHLYDSGKQLSGVQLVTWNDYEEATEIESGIDNCFAVHPSVSGNALQWKVSGDEGTIDHYSVYISEDGENLMSLADLAAGVHSLNLCSFSIPGGNYQLFVQAVGKPSLANQTSKGFSYSPTCAFSAPVASKISFSAAPDKITLPAGKSGDLTVTAQMQSGVSNDPISLSCAGLPNTLTCSFSPATIAPGSGTAMSTLTISPVAVNGLNFPLRRKALPIYASWSLSLGIFGLALMGNAGRRRAQGIAIIALLGLVTLGTSCGVSNGPKTAAPVSTVSFSPVPKSYSITVNGSSTSNQFSAPITVVVQ